MANFSAYSSHSEGSAQPEEASEESLPPESSVGCRSLKSSVKPSCALKAEGGETFAATPKKGSPYWPIPPFKKQATSHTSRRRSEERGR